EISFNLRDASNACVVVSDIPAIGRDPGFTAKLCRTRLGESVIHRDLVAFSMKCLGNRRTNAACPACYQSNPAHIKASPVSLRQPLDMPRWHFDDRRDQRPSRHMAIPMP